MIYCMYMYVDLYSVLAFLRKVLSRHETSILGSKQFVGTVFGKVLTSHCRGHVNHLELQFWLLYSR